MHIHIIQHESFEAPGAYYVWAISRGHEVSFTRCWKGDVLPESMEGIDWLLIMGGPQSPDTTEAECPYFHSQKEQQLMRDAMSHGKIVLGVCLGAQLMGAALGAGVERSPEKEVGLVKLYLTEEGQKDPITRVLPPEFVSGAWHGDMPGLTKDSVILASGGGCPRQIVRYGRKAYGFQCHLEFTRKTVDGLIAHAPQDLENPKHSPYIMTAEQIREYDYTTMNDQLFFLLDQLG